MAVKIALILGVAAVSFLFPAWALGALLIYAAIATIRKNIPAIDKRFVMIIAMVAVSLKLIFALIYFYAWLIPGHPDLIGPDGEGFSQRGWYISRVLSDKVSYEAPTTEYVFKKFYRVVDAYKGELPPFSNRGNGLFTYFIGIVYSLLGYVPLLIKMLNIFLITVASIVVYRIGMTIYGRNTARTAFFIFSFFPSIFIFSATALREPLFILCITTSIYTLIRLIMKRSVKDIVVLIISLSLILFLREELFVIMVAVTALSILLCRRVKHKIVVVFFIVLIGMTITNVKIFHKLRFEPKIFFSRTAPILFYRNATIYFTGGNLAYKTFDDKHYSLYRSCASEEEYLSSPGRVNALDIIKTSPRAVFYYLARPFPSFDKGLIYGLLSIHMLVWYTVFIAAFFGMFYSPPRKSPIYPILLFMLIVVATTCIFEANEGTLLRHRDFIAPFLIIFASAYVNRTVDNRIF